MFVCEGVTHLWLRVFAYYESVVLQPTLFDYFDVITNFEPMEKSRRGKNFEHDEQVMH
jgi:hypothetical protein